MNHQLSLFGLEEQQGYCCPPEPEIHQDEPLPSPVSCEPTPLEQVLLMDENVVWLREWSQARRFPRLVFPVYLDAEFKKMNLVTIEGEEQWATFLAGDEEGQWILDGRFTRAWLAAGAYDIQNRQTR